MGYLNLNISHKREIQKNFIAKMDPFLKDDSKIDQLIDWENKNEILTWLDGL